MRNILEVSCATSNSREKLSRPKQFGSRTENAAVQRAFWKKSSEDTVWMARNSEFHQDAAQPSHTRFAKWTNWTKRDTLMRVRTSPKIQSERSSCCCGRMAKLPKRILNVTSSANVDVANFTVRAWVLSVVLKDGQFWLAVSMQEKCRSVRHATENLLKVLGGSGLSSVIKSSSVLMRAKWVHNVPRIRRSQQTVRKLHAKQISPFAIDVRDHWCRATDGWSNTRQTDDQIRQKCFSNPTVKTETSPMTCFWLSYAIKTRRYHLFLLKRNISVKRTFPEVADVTAWTAECRAA